MPFKLIVIFSFLTLAVSELLGQPNSVISVTSAKNNSETLPGQIVNLPFFIENKSEIQRSVNTILKIPADWKHVTPTQNFILTPGEKKFLIYTVQIPSNNALGDYDISLSASEQENNTTIGFHTISIAVGEVENIQMILVESPDYVIAGEKFRGTFLLQNGGNTAKKVFIETRNCQMERSGEVDIKPGESVQFSVEGQTSQEITESRNEYYTVRALISGEVVKSIFRPVMIIPSGETRKDLFFRFPIRISTTYLASNQRDKYEHGYQFELSGKGSLDLEGRHKLEFLARGPNNNNLSFLGLYDQYFISYSNDKIDFFVGEKSFEFTPLTESSRFGMGTESRLKFNNGLNLGFLYVKPRYFQEIKNELAVFSGFEFNKKNRMDFYFISKQTNDSPEKVPLFSLNSLFQPFKRTSLELEFSSGRISESLNHGIRANIHSQFLIFNIAGSYYYTGKNYPGYFTNSTFYSGNFSVKLTPKLNVGFYAKEDFLNAQLDTFFVTAPYSRSFQSMINYNIATRSNVKIYWRNYERKDRLVADKFHYETRSLNSQFSQRFKKVDYNLIGEYGETTNFLLEPSENRQDTYRGSASLAYRFNAMHAMRVFGSWSNINQFVSGDQRNLTAGMSVMSHITQNLMVNFHLQNAYNIEDYYRNRNLMQLNLDFFPGKKHQFSLRSFYTLFRRQTENPEFTFSFNYSYNLGIPLRKVIKAGELGGRVFRENGLSPEGILLTFQNKTTITGKNGEFSFRSVPTGKHLLIVDHSGLAIDEVTQIPDPFTVEIFEDQKTEFDIQILKGARFSGQFEVEKNSIPAMGGKVVKAQNIIVELKNEREQFRIASDLNGRFSFPLVRPGNWTFRIYENNIPAGYEVEKLTRKVQLESGQIQNVVVSLNPKKRNIIFKPQITPLTPLKPVTKDAENKESSSGISGVFYSVQVGAFRNLLSREDSYFADEPYEFKTQDDNWHKYFIGRFATFSEAVEEMKRLETRFSNPFIVKFEKDQIIQIENRN